MLDVKHTVVFFGSVQQKQFSGPPPDKSQLPEMLTKLPFAPRSGYKGRNYFVRVFWVSAAFWPVCATGHYRQATCITIFGLGVDSNCTLLESRLTDRETSEQSELRAELVRARQPAGEYNLLVACQV